MSDMGTTVGGTHVDMPQKHSNFEIDNIIQNQNIFRGLYFYALLKGIEKDKKTVDVKKTNYYNLFRVSTYSNRTIGRQKH